MMRTRRLVTTGLLGAVILLAGCGAVGSTTSQSVVTSTVPVASTNTSHPPLTTTTSTTPPSVSPASVAANIQQLIRFGALPNDGKVPDAVVSCPTFHVATGSYFACNISSQTVGGVTFVGQITNATTGTFVEITYGSALACSSLNSGEQKAMKTIGSCVPETGTVPTIEINGINMTKPSTIGFSGDGGNIPKDLVWSGWGTDTATAVGTVALENCIPDCADGSRLNVPVTVSVTDLYDGRYGSITETIQGHAPQTNPLPYGAAS